MYSNPKLPNIMQKVIHHFPEMGVKQCHKPSMTGNGNHTTYSDDWGMVYLLFCPHYI
jgi:hypothetical protein